MPSEEVSYDDLTVNPDNDRHGSLGGEPRAIEWLLAKKPEHMRNLARDIAKTGQLYEEPLVLDIGGKLIVCDGNRRVTCIKLLNNPEDAPTEDWQKFFGELKSQKDSFIPKMISCRVETDEDLVDEILYRRHTGTQKGVGQSPWDDEAKHNFILRTGKHTRVNIAQEIEDLLKNKGYIHRQDRIPKSNLNRLLSGAPQRARVGLRVNKNELFFTHEPEEVMKTLYTIGKDLMEKRVVLGDLWNDVGKSAYLARLASEGRLPEQNAALALDLPVNDYKKRPKKAAKPSTFIRTEQLAERKHLIPEGTDAEIPQLPVLLKIRMIWQELQNRLEFGKHDNAIAVLFRVLLDLSLDHYILTHGIKNSGKSHLHIRLMLVANHQVREKSIEKDFLATAKKFSSSDELISAHTMNKYVHSSQLAPSPDHLRAMWASLQKFIINCLTK